MRHTTTARAMARVSVVLALLIAYLVTGGGSATAAVDANQTFIGYGYLPSDAHAAAVAEMNAYSSSCQEISTTYSGAGSEHYWKATLTADC
jgi:hypothetical protein